MPKWLAVFACANIWMTAAHAQNFPVELRVSGDSMATGSSAAHPSTVNLALAGIPATSAWVDLRMQLPPGVHFLGQTAWSTNPTLPTSCEVSVRPDGGEDVNCRSTGISASARSHFASAQLAIPMDAPLAADGSFSIRYSAHLPGHDPDSANCSTTGGRIFVGCADLTHIAGDRHWTPRGYAHAEIPASGAPVAGTPLRVGSRGRLGIDWNYAGSFVPGIPVVAHVLLPSGVQYTPTASMPLAAGSNCALEAPVDGREHLRCTFSAINMTSYHMLSPLVLTLGRGVTGGQPIIFHAVVDADYQPMPADWLTNPGQACDACFAISVPTVGPRVAISTAMPLPSMPWAVNRPAELDVWLRNSKIAGASGALHLHVQLPPGMTYLSNEAAGWPIAACTTQASVAGQVLTCSWSTPLGPQENRRILLKVTSDTTLAAPGPVPILFALEEYPSPNAGSELDRCAANPDVPSCFLINQPTRFDCASQFSDGVFCDGFEPFVRPDP